MTDFVIPDWPAPAGVRALVTTRAQGNLADHVGDDPSAVAARRSELCRWLPSQPRWLSQVHGTCCADAAAASGTVVADAAATRTPGVVCAVLTADCLPVLFCDETGGAVAAAHAGWRGLAAGVLESTVAALAVPEDRLLAWLGPAISPQAYEVGDDVRDAFTSIDAAASEDFTARENGRWSCDLYALARRRLRALGVERLYGGGFCTHRESARFYSHRREGLTGRMASLIWIV